MKIAVIGSGITGLGAAWALRDHADVTVFEKAPRLGGHSNTMTVADPGQPLQPVDTGFIVYNLATYPNLIALFNQLGVETISSNMSFAVSLDGGKIEYSGDSLATLIGHPGNLLRPSHLAMMRDLVRFYRSAPALYAAPPEQTLGAFLAQHHYSRAFADNHLLPMAAAIWSAAPQKILDFPVGSFGAFFRNHGLLELDAKKRPEWRTVKGGSIQYVEKLAKAGRAKIITDAKITAIRSTSNQPSIRFADGMSQFFDHIICASHADETLALMDQANDDQRRILGAISYSANDTYLHHDIALMPKRKHLWASWNYLRPTPDDVHAPTVAVTYWMNRLQNFKSAEPFLVTLNPPRPPAGDKTVAHMLYHHPQQDNASLAARQQLRTIQGKDRLWFCGSYCGYGFHEDGLASGLAVATALGAPRPWPITDVSPAFANATPAT